jgi:hypothetical protein
MTDEPTPFRHHFPDDPLCLCCDQCHPLPCISRLWGGECNRRRCECDDPKTDFDLRKACPACYLECCVGGLCQYGEHSRNCLACNGTGRKPKCEHCDDTGELLEISASLRDWHVVPCPRCRSPIATAIRNASERIRRGGTEKPDGYVAFETLEAAELWLKRHGLSIFRWELVDGEYRVKVRDVEI